MSRLLLRSLRSPPAVAALAVAGSFSAASVRPSSLSEGVSFDKPTFSERTVGSYENRLRKFSAPERVFEYFSSVEIDRHYFMTRDDLARAVTPYTYRHGAPTGSKNPKFNAKASADKTPQELADRYLQKVQKLLLETPKVTKVDVEELLAFRDEKVDFETHVKTLRTLQITNAEFDQFVVREKTFFDLVDADGDGMISYPEYIFFNTLLAIPERQFELAFKMFDADDNGELDHREFKQVGLLYALQVSVSTVTYSIMLYFDRSLHDDDDVPIFKHLFGELATKTLSYEDFCAFRRDLKQEILRIQISFPPVMIATGKLTLSPREFGMFLVSHVDQGHISEQEFIDFNVFLEHLDELKVAMDLVMQDRGVNKEQFQRATKAALRGSKTTKPVTPLQIDILFALFDLDST
uniref:EF-hand domain-containing protein n=1 Tax=Phytophthora ramorum TaxID=164328 RepID=H3GLG2_PHYRM